MSIKSNKINQFIEKYSASLPPEAVQELELIAQEEDYLRKAFDFNPCTICVIDESNNYLNANEKMLNILKVDSAELLGKKVGSLTKDPTIINLIEDLRLSTEDAKHITIEVLVAGQKKFFWISANKVGTRILTTGLDITELKQLEEEKKFNDKLALLGEMSSFIVHEINNPLSSIIMATEIIEMENLDNINNKTLSKYTEQIKSMSAVIEKIIDSLKSVVRKDNQSSTTVSLQDVFDKSRIILSGKIKKSKVRITTENLDQAIVFGNELNLVQVLVNLISNSIDALSAVDNKWIKIEWQDGILKVVDAGLGIPVSVKDNLFKKYYTSKGEAGNGIGLYLSRELLRKMGYDLIYKVDSGHTSFQWVPLTERIAA